MRICGDIRFRLVRNSTIAIRRHQRRRCSGNLFSFSSPTASPPPSLLPERKERNFCDTLLEPGVYSATKEPGTRKNSSKLRGYDFSVSWGASLCQWLLSFLTRLHAHSTKGMRKDISIYCSEYGTRFFTDSKEMAKI